MFKEVHYSKGKWFCDKCWGHEKCLKEVEKVLDEFFIMYGDRFEEIELKKRLGI
jgi:hypothetical protein